MVGGTVIGIIRKTDKTILNVQGTRSERNDTLCINVKEKAGQEISLGDSVWWQSHMAFWTPKESPRDRQGVNFDIVLERIGYSYEPAGAD